MFGLVMQMTMIEVKNKKDGNFEGFPFCFICHS